MKQAKKVLSMVLAVIICFCTLPFSTVTTYAESCEHHLCTTKSFEAPTCIQDGELGKGYCIICGTTLYFDAIGNIYYYNYVVPQLGHTDTDTDYICDRCHIILEMPEPEQPSYNIENGYYYTVENSEATIIAVDETISGDIVIPSTLGGYPVSVIGEYAFADNVNITSVVIPEGIIKISGDAFYLCLKLENIALPESLKVIEGGVFYSCISLKEIIIPENVTVIGNAILTNCHSLKKVIIKNPETIIGDYITYAEISPKGITAEEWVEKYLVAYDAMINEDENADVLMEDFAKYVDEHPSEPRILPNLTIYSYAPSTAKNYADANGVQFKTLEQYEKENHTCTFGEWYTVTEATVFAQGGKRRDCECGEYETDVIPKLEKAVTKDETTKVEITYTDDNFDKAVEVVVSEEAVNANVVFENEYENYKSYNISLVVDGKKVQPNGNVTVKLPLPADFNAESIAVYYVDSNGNKTRIDSKVENSFVVFETDHFSEYVIIDESSKIKEPTVPDEPIVPNEPDTPTDPTEDCSCNCHKGGFAGLIFKIINFFQKLFGKNKVCACGVKH